MKPKTFSLLALALVSGCTLALAYGGCTTQGTRKVPPSQESVTPLDPHRVVSITRIQNKPSRVDLDMGIDTVPDTVVTTTADGVTTVHTPPDPLIEVVRNAKVINSGP